MLGLCTLASAQSYKENSYKNWNDGPLTQEDFTSRHLASTLQDVAGELKWTISFQPVTDKFGNLRYRHLTTQTRMDKLRSWMDPEHWQPWSLDYFQSEFDMVECFRRKLQAELDANPLDLDEIEDYYDRMLNSAGETLQQETDLGRDAAAVARYAVQYKEELDKLEPAPDGEPQFKRMAVGLGWDIGYAGEVFGAPVAEGVGSIHGVGFCFSFPIKRIYAGFDTSFGSTSLKKDAFYHDPRLDYDWQKGQKCEGGQICFQLGYTLLDQPRFSLCPVAGIGGTFLSQDTGLKKNDDDSVSSNINGLRLEAGLNGKLKLRRSLDVIYQYGGNAYGETSLVFKIYGVRSQLPSFGEVWSVHFGVALDWSAWMLKTNRSVL